MSHYVVDASVAAKWYVPENHSDAADTLLREEYDLHAPDLLLAELGNILWKKFVRKELSGAEVRTIVRALPGVPIEIHRSEAILQAAVEIALGTSRTVYDSLYLALALFLDCPFVTADDRLSNALRMTDLATHVRHVKNL